MVGGLQSCNPSRMKRKWEGVNYFAKDLQGGLTLLEVRKRPTLNPKP